MERSFRFSAAAGKAAGVAAGLLLLVLVLAGCPNPTAGLGGGTADDAASADDADSQALAVTGFDTAVPENPAAGEVLGTVTAAVGGESVTYSVSSQTVSGALAVNDAGEVTVADPALFDYEANPVVEAVVEASTASNSGVATVTVNVEDVIIDPDNGLLAYYPLDGDYRDYSGNGHDGLEIDSVSAAADRNDAAGKAMDFSAGNVTVPLTAEYSPYSSFTFSAWVRDDGNATELYRTIVAKSYQGYVEFSFRVNPLGEQVWENGGLGAFFNNSGTNSLRNGTNWLPAGTWTHVALTFDADGSATAGVGTARLYQNGTEVASKEDISLTLGNGELSIGGQTYYDTQGGVQTTQSFSGFMDDVLFFDRVLAAAEVAALQDEGSSGSGTRSLPTLSVTYDGNGADTGTAPVDAGAYQPGDTVTVLDPGDLALTDGVFNGWNTQQGGGGATYSAGSTFTITADTTLYAQWGSAIIVEQPIIVQ